jgi:predicted phage baseplate assembly protein
VLPAPNLDDRRFQDLVDDAKRMIQKRCPEWTDHNVSDPGVTLIELFASMTDQLVYRLNRVPDRNYIKFLELVGVRPYPATPAHTDITFWLSGPIEQPVVAPAGTRVSTVVSDLADAVVFMTGSELAMPPCELACILTGHEKSARTDHSRVLTGGQRSFSAFSAVPTPGDHLFLGLSTPLPSCAVAFEFDCRIEGVGVDPANPPLVWEAWDGQGWVRCDLDRDETGGLNRRGVVVVHLPPDHEASVIDKKRAGWVRCTVVAAHDDQPSYQASPEIVAVSARTAGGTTRSAHADEVVDEILGLSEGVPGQRFQLEHWPVLGGDGPLHLDVADVAGWTAWTQVESFAGKGENDRVFVLDEASGEIAFGPAVRKADGSVTPYGAVPAPGAPIRVPRYRTGGGRRGNVAARKLTQLTSAIPYVDRVVNRHAATGGVDAETIDSVRQRGPIVLHTRHRAVTAADYEHLAREVAPNIARVRCLPATSRADDGAARLLVVPAVRAADEQLPYEQLFPSDEMLARIAGYLDERRTIATRLVVEPPPYQGVTIVAELRAKATAVAQALHDAAVAALHRYFHPTLGGPDGTGWPFGRPVHVGEVYAVLQRLEGIEFVESARLHPADPVSGERGRVTDRIDLEPTALVYSYAHQVRVEEG